MIFVLGRKDLGTGILRNRTDGGEGASGAVQSEEKKRKCSVAKSGKTHTEEHRRKNSVAHSGANNPRFGVPNSEAQKKAHSERMSGRHLGALSPCSKAIIAIAPRRHARRGRASMDAGPGEGWLSYRLHVCRLCRPRRPGLGRSARGGPGRSSSWAHPVRECDARSRRCPYRSTVPWWVSSTAVSWKDRTLRPGRGPRRDGGRPGAGGRKVRRGGVTGGGGRISRGRGPWSQRISVHPVPRASG